MHVFLGNAERLGDITCGPGDHLIGRPEGELVGVPCCDRGMRLHHRVRLVGRGVGGVELHGCSSEGTGEVADRRLGLAAFALGSSLGGLTSASQIERPLGFFVIDLDQLRRRAGLFEGLGHDERDGLVIVIDLGTAKEFRGVVFALSKIAGVLGGDDGNHTRGGLGPGKIRDVIRPLAIAAPTM